MKLSKIRHKAGYGLAAWIFVWGGGWLPGQEAVAEAYEPVKLKHVVEAVIPAELRPLLIEKPQVEFRVVVDANGQATDWLAVKATHYGLLEKAEAKLEEAEYEPAKRDGKPVSGKITVIVTFFDPEQRIWREGGITAPMGGNVSDAVDRKLYGLNPARYQYKESRVSELDAPPEILETQLYLVHPPEAEPPKGDVVVDYYVDHTGQVRLPAIVESDDESLSLSALMTLRETRFQPPRKDGQPTYIRIRQPFHFD